MKTIFRSNWSTQIGDKWQTRNAEKKQVIHLMAEEKIERWSKIVARCGTMSKLLLESDDLKEVTCKKCLEGMIGRHFQND